MARQKHDSDKIKVGYDAIGTQPKKIQLQIPGFAGEDRTHDTAQPWQCKPFTDAATSGFELVWPFDCTVLIESPDGENVNIPDSFSHLTGNGHTVVQFARGHYGINVNVRLSMPKGWGGLVLPHPRWWEDPFNSDLPAIVPGVLEFDWWPKYFFVVSKAPAKRRVQALRYNEPFVQIIPIPLRKKVELEALSDKDRLELEDHSSLIERHYSTVSTHNWQTKNGKHFGNIYKILAGEFKKKGKIDWEAIRALQND